MHLSIRNLALACTVIGAAAFPAFAAEDHSIYYGSRVGMHLTTVSKTGIGTANAVIVVKHTPKDAKAYCVGYEMDNSMACVKRAMAEVKVGDRVTGNCRKRTWTDMYGQSYAFEGPTQTTDSMAEYDVRDIKSGELLDDSSASGYGLALNIFQQLCPGIAK